MTSELSDGGSAGLLPLDRAKYLAARRAVALVEDGMMLGLGTGSTATWMLRCLGERVRNDGLRVTGVPTSGRTADLARAEGIALTTLDEAKWLDLTLDGADEFDANLNLIKGGGGALLLEKIVAAASDRMVVIADAAKEVASLGAYPLPVEVVRFGWATTELLIADLLGSLDVLGRGTALRQTDGLPFQTDEGNFIIDLHLNRIDDPRHLALLLNQVPGVVENGLFIDLCDMVVIGHGDGRVEMRDMVAGTVTDDRDAAASAGCDNLFSDV